MGQKGWDPGSGAAVLKRTVDEKAPKKGVVCTFGQRGEFHISHDASLRTILSSFRTHVILSVQQGRYS